MSCDKVFHRNPQSSGYADGSIGRRDGVVSIQVIVYILWPKELKIANKRVGLGILVIALVLGMTACGSGAGGGADPGRLTINNLSHGFESRIYRGESPESFEDLSSMYHEYVIDSNCVAFGHMGGGNEKPPYSNLLFYVHNSGGFIETGSFLVIIGATDENDVMKSKLFFK
jgi:hypothetical protein